MLRVQNRTKEIIVELGRSGMAHRGKDTAEWHVDRSFKKCNKGRR